MSLLPGPSRRSLGLAVSFKNELSPFVTQFQVSVFVLLFSTPAHLLFLGKETCVRMCACVCVTGSSQRRSLAGLQGWEKLFFKHKYLQK